MWMTQMVTAIKQWLVENNKAAWKESGGGANRNSDALAWWKAGTYDMTLHNGEKCRASISKEGRLNIL